MGLTKSEKLIMLRDIETYINNLEKQRKQIEAELKEENEIRVKLLNELYVQKENI